MFLALMSLQIRDIGTIKCWNSSEKEGTKIMGHLGN